MESWQAQQAAQWNSYLENLGAYIRSQRKLANLSLRQLAAMANVSNPYLSQIERGLHEPSVHVLSAIAQALDLATEDLLARVGFLKATVEDGEVPPKRASAEAAIRQDPELTDAQKDALLAVYRSYRAENA